MHPILQDILQHKKQSLAALHQRFDNNRQTRSQTATFYTKLKQKPFNLIAEFKRTSPAVGQLNLTADVATQTQAYQRAGASAVSILTENKHFHGQLEDISTAQHCGLPVLRKDFIIDDIQLDESVAAGCDAVLLIYSLLGDQTQALLNAAKARGLDVLLEIHTADELAAAIDLSPQLIGINNRDLNTFMVQPRHALELAERHPTNIPLIAESGIHTAEVAQAYREAGFLGILVGSALMQSDNPSASATALLGGHHAD